MLIAETNWSHGGDKIIVKKDVRISDIPKKPVGIYLEVPSVIFFLDQYLQDNGLKYKDVRVIEMETDTLSENFIKDRFNVIVNYDPEAIRAERKGGGRVVVTSADYEGCIPEGLITLKSILETIPPEDHVKIHNGWAKAVAWSKKPDNRAEYMDIMRKYTYRFRGPFSDADLQEMLNNVSIHDAPRQLERNQDDGGLYTYLRNLRDFLAGNDLLRKEFKPEDIFDNTAVVTALEQKIASDPQEPAATQDTK